MNRLIFMGGTIAVVRPVRFRWLANYCRQIALLAPMPGRRARNWGAHQHGGRRIGNKMPTDAAKQITRFCTTLFAIRLDSWQRNDVTSALTNDAPTLFRLERNPPAGVFAHLIALLLAVSS